MKLSGDTLTLLKNFSTINPSLIFKKGSVISTLSNGKNILATANIVEVFPMDFAIYDLSEFLGAVSLFTDPDFDFKEKYLVISSGSSKIKYFYADPSGIVSPTKGITMPECEISFEFTKEGYESLL
ncbi:MAG: hypothetical protein GYA69_05130, partial [Candidatus Moranbacteria bacterium]|nr:hypothetical protein [Candidatus Moranbacteria bacterium]